MINLKNNIEYLNWYICGLVDAEGSFGVNVVKHATNKTGYAVLTYFELAMNSKDKQLLELIKKTFDLECNIYHNPSDDTLKFKVSNIEQIVNKIIPFFEKYTLFSQKRGDFILFCKVVELIKNKEHLTLNGLMKILSIKAAMNLGLSENLKKEFPGCLSVKRPEFGLSNLNKRWLAGFIEGEACFFVSIYNSPKSKLGKAVQLVFKITQHIRDKILIESIVELLNCGRVEVRKSNEACDFTVTSIKEIENYIIPFFNEYPLIGQKLKNYEDFKLIFDMMKTKDHLTEEGLSKIIEIKNKMNTNRI
uniref:LAGLIDADG homing endonuclease n=1 Tax=Leptographium truncatum TaxID=330483 RepID=E0YCK3_9PEZI|nr:LAGLIDADG homing endonuclease I-LtrII [Leptographium truncatum]ADZ76452.1 LAGLIDADG homing endonuclease [Leptographium truncatum]4LQ0_A Chain A, LAGLIDADG homing endonuclease [Leptographium truncatum]